MLTPDARTPVVTLLTPPPGFTLDRAVITTYTVDLEALLVLPIAQLAGPDVDVAQLLGDPARIVEAVRSVRHQLAVFYHADAIRPPRAGRTLFGLLEDCLHPTLPPLRKGERGVFHPKAWVLRFQAEDAVVLRVAVLSRNLTFDRSWDVLFASEGSPHGRRGRRQSAGLGELLEALPALSPTLEPTWREAIEALAQEVRRTAFPDPFDGGTASFHALGLGRRPLWWAPPLPEGDNVHRVLAVSPFLKGGAIQALRERSAGSLRLLSREAELQRELGSLDGAECWVLADGAHDPDEDGESQLAGLHAKVLLFEHARSSATWFLGSANLTDAAWSQRNVELMVELQTYFGRRKSDGSVGGNGIEPFLSAMQPVLQRYHPTEEAAAEESEGEAEEVRRLLRAARQAIGAAEWRLVCRRVEGGYQMMLEGEAALPPNVAVSYWPVSLDQSEARPLTERVWTLAPESLTALLGFEIRAPAATGVDPIRLALKVPAEGLPRDRDAHILKSAIGNRSSFFRYLRALLAEVDGVGWSPPPPGGGGGNGDTRSARSVFTSGMFEDLLRAAVRAPARLEPVRRLIRDLQESGDPDGILPADFVALWSAIEAALEAAP